MHQTIKKISAMALISVISAVALAATPPERVTANITREAASGLQLQETLTKNLFRQESVEVPYKVQEPYQVEETYYVDVPYQDQETYYEQVPYNDTEYYTDYEDYYEREERCENRTHNERVCRNRESCHIVPGTSEGGGPRRECITVEECSNNPRSERVCNWENVRKTRPVQRSRTVTKYRQEARTRTVTKYRQEARTRSVTKYREKELCCKTKIVEVFDRQYNVPVRVAFPAGTELVSGEKETFTLTLSGSESAPVVTLTPKQTIFGYKVLRQQPHAGGVEIELATAPLYTAADLGLATIKNLRLEINSKGTLLSFEDLGLKPRVQTSYFYQLREVGASVILAEGEIKAGSSKVREALAVTLAEDREYQLDFHLLREGLPLSAPVDESTSVVQKIAPLKNEELHMRRDQIRTFEVRGHGAETRLFFIDTSPLDEGVSTVYKIEILLGGEKAPVASSKEIRREEMPMGTKNFFKLSLRDDLGVSEKELTDKVRRGKAVTVRLTTTREHPRLNQGQSVVLRHQFVQEIE